MSNKDNRTDFTGLGGERLQGVEIPMEAGLARRLKNYSEWADPDRFNEQLADAIRERLDEAEQVRERRGGFRIDPDTGRIVEEE